MTSHPMKMAKYCYSAKELDPKWNFLLPDEIPVLEKAIEKLKAEERELRIMLREAADQSTENMGHDDAPQESVRLALWTLTSKMDYLRDAYIHHTLLKVPTKRQKRLTFGMKATLKGVKTLEVALLGGSDLPLSSGTIHEGISVVTYRSPFGKVLLGKKAGDVIKIGNLTYKVESVSIL